jgi:hypothetical protein
MFAWPEGEVVRNNVHNHQGKHQHHDNLKSPIPMDVRPKMMARMSVVSCLGSFALDSVLVAFHGIPNK